MSLTASVRTRIWSLAIAFQQAPKNYSNIADSPCGSERIHPLTRVSREVRAKTLALAWADLKVEYKPSIVNTGTHRGSKCARRFYQLEALKRSDKVSRVLPVYATFSIFEKMRVRRLRTKV